MLHNSIKNVVDISLVGAYQVVNSKGCNKVIDILDKSYEVNSIPSELYDAVLYSNIVPQLNESFYGWIFLDSKTSDNHPFDNGTPIRTSTVLDVQIPVDGIYLIKTRNTNYLVV